MKEAATAPAQRWALYTRAANTSVGGRPVIDTDPTFAPEKRFPVSAAVGVAVIVVVVVVVAAFATATASATGRSIH